MIDKTDYVKNAQKAVNDGMETFLNWGNAAIDNTFSMYEQGIAARDTNIAEARKQFQELESNLTQKLNNQKEQFKSMAIELSEAYWPESKQLMEQAEKFYQDNIDEVVKKNREMLESNIDNSLKSNLGLEKKWVAQLRENYARGSENLRKQFDMLVPQATAKIEKPVTKAKKKNAEETPAKIKEEKDEAAPGAKSAETKINYLAYIAADKAKPEVKAKEKETDVVSVAKAKGEKKPEVKAKEKNAEETPAKIKEEKDEAAPGPKSAAAKVAADNAKPEVKAKEKKTEVVSEAKSAVKKTPAAETSQLDRKPAARTDSGTPAMAPNTEPLTLRTNPDFSGKKLRKNSHDQ